MPDELPQSSLLLYQTPDGQTRIECRFDQDTLWLSQAQIAELFQTTAPNINIHLGAIYEDGELSGAATIKSRLIVRSEGQRHLPGRCASARATMVPA